MVVDHLSCLGPEVAPSEELPTDDSFPDDQLLTILHQATPWYADLVNFKVCGVMPPGFSYQKAKKLLSNTKYYMWKEPLLYKFYRDGVYKKVFAEG